MDENDNIFVELSKVKNEPVEIKMENENYLTSKNDEEEGTLTVDVYDDGDKLIIQSTVAGVDENDLVVDINPGEVTIKGERKRNKKIDESKYLYQELFWGKFSRSIILPEEVDPEEATATLSKGILTIQMPKLHRARKSKQLKVKVSE